MNVCHFTGAASVRSIYRNIYIHIGILSSTYEVSELQPPKGGAGGMSQRFSPLTPNVYVVIEAFVVCQNYSCSKTKMCLRPSTMTYVCVVTEAFVVCQNYSFSKTKMCLRPSTLTSMMCAVTEAFVVCQNYSPPKDYVPNMSNPLLDHHYGLYGFLVTLSTGPS